MCYMTRGRGGTSNSVKCVGACLGPQNQDLGSLGMKLELLIHEKALSMLWPISCI